MEKSDVNGLERRGLADSPALRATAYLQWLSDADELVVAEARRRLDDLAGEHAAGLLHLLPWLVAARHIPWARLRSKPVPERPV